MVKQILFIWIRMFFGVIAVSYLIALKYPEFAPKPLYTLVFSFVFALVMGIIRTKNKVK